MRCMWYYYEMYPDSGNRQQLVDDFVWLEIVLKMGTILSIACKCAFHNIKDAFHGIISERNHTNIRKTYRIISSLGQRPGLMDDAIHHADPGIKTSFNRRFVMHYNCLTQSGGESG